MSAPEEQRPEVLSLERARNRSNAYMSELKDLYVQIASDFTRKGWPFSVLASYHGSHVITLETWVDLWAVVTSGGATDDAWGKALVTALEWATRDDRTTGIEEGLRHERQRAAKRWVRNNRRSFAALPQEVLAWAPFEF